MNGSVLAEIQLAAVLTDAERAAVDIPITDAEMLQVEKQIVFMRSNASITRSLNREGTLLLKSFRRIRVLEERLAHSRPRSKAQSDATMVLAAMGTGEITVTRLLELLPDMVPKTIYNALGHLYRAGRIDRVGHGIYRAVRP